MAVTVPSPAVQDRSLAPFSRPSGVPNGQETHLTWDDGTSSGTLDGLVYERPERMNGGRHGLPSGIHGDSSHLDPDQDVSSFGPATVTIAYAGPRIPFTLRVRTNNSDTATDTDTDYDMGPSNQSQDISLATVYDTITWLKAIRRF